MGVAFKLAGANIGGKGQRVGSQIFRRSDLLSAQIATELDRTDRFRSAVELRWDWMQTDHHETESKQAPRSEFAGAPMSEGTVKKVWLEQERGSCAVERLHSGQ